MAKIAVLMNEAGYPTPTGGTWSYATVRRALNWNPPVEKQQYTFASDPHELLKKDPKNKLALADLDDRARYFASGNLDIWAIRHINEEYSK
jgi:hypothetical protein